jgi:UDPglucose 6-dehydrogenase
MKIAIIGSGVVGFATGRGFSKVGNDVCFFDINPKTLEEIRKEGYKTEGDLSKVIEEYDVFIVCVPTPTKKGSSN